MGGCGSKLNHSWIRYDGTRSMRSLLNPISSRALARMLGWPMTMADVRSALASKNFATKYVIVESTQKYMKRTRNELVGNSPKIT